MHVLQMNQIQFSYGKGQPFIRDFSANIQKGEIVNLAGLNGAGKTTLIRLAATLSTPSSGRCIYFDDPDLPLQQVRRRMGYASQEVALYGDETVLDNLRLFGGLYGLDKQALNHRIMQLSEWLELADNLPVRVNQCSGGTRRKTHLAAAMLHHPELLVLDEPTAGIDIKTADVMMNSLRQLAQDGTAILCAAHSLDEMLTLTGRVMVLHKGEVAGTVELPSEPNKVSDALRQQLKTEIIQLL